MNNFHGPVREEIWWRTPFGEWFKGEIVAITPDGPIVNRLVPYGAFGIPLRWDMLDEFSRRDLQTRIVKDLC